MPSINAKKGANDRSSLGSGVGRVREALNSPAGRIAGLLLGATPYGAAVNAGRMGLNVANRVGYMFDNDPGTGFWRGDNVGQPMFQGTRDFLGDIFGPRADRNYQGPPSINAGGAPPAQPSPYDDSYGLGWIGEAMRPNAPGGNKPNLGAGNLSGHGARGTVASGMGWRGYGGTGGPLGGSAEGGMAYTPYFIR